MKIFPHIYMIAGMVQDGVSRLRVYMGEEFKEVMLLMMRLTST